MAHWKNATSDLLHPLATHRRLGLITDIDGTVSPITEIPDLAQVTPRNLALLESLLPCCALVAAVSGRAAADIQHRVGLTGMVYIGNHGLERWQNGEVLPDPAAARFRPAMEAAIQTLTPRLVPGAWIEDKGATLSIHYRQTNDPALAAEQLRPVIEKIADAQGLRLFHGRMVFELRPPVEADKGTAFRHLVSEFSLDAAIYLGDDTTDVDALRAARQLRQAGDCYAVGLGVQSPDMPAAVGEAADIMASGVSDVEAFLSWLLDSRKASSTC